MLHAALALGFGLVLTLVLYPAFLSQLVSFRAGQRIQEYGPASHATKVGTPTMGGLLFCVVIAAAWLLFDRSRAGFVLAFAFGGGAALGLVDDVANVRGQGALGLLGRQKLLLQAVIGVLVGMGLNQIGATHQILPWLGAPDLGVAIVPLAALVVVCASNAVNITDGVDGLAATCCAVAFGALLFIALGVHNLPAIVISATTLGALGGFLVFNWFPARVFMGDTGSLALGCALVAVSAELHLLWLLPLLGIVFVVETLSVIVNVTAIRKFHRRILRSSPIHHHFEALGFREPVIVAGFGFVALLAAVATALYAHHLGGLV